MSFKAFLNVSISLSMALSPLAARADILTSNADAVTLLLESLKTNNPDEAKKLINKARVKARSENLPPENLERINALLDRATEKLKQSKPVEETKNQTAPSAETSSQAQPNPSATNPNPKLAGKNRFQTQNAPTYAGGTPISVVEAGADELSKLLNENPDLRASMLEIGEGRLNRDSSQIDQIIARKTGKSPAYFDLQQRTELAAMDQFGALIAMLRSSGPLLTNQQCAIENAALRDRYPKTDTETLANYVIQEYTAKAFLAGMAKKLVANNDIKMLQLAGVSMEAAVTFVINANLTLRLANLYDMRLSLFEQELILYGGYAAARILWAVPAFWSESGKGVIIDLAKSLGAKIAEIRASPGISSSERFVRLKALFARFMKTPTVAKVAKLDGSILPEAAPTTTETPPTEKSPGSTHEHIRAKAIRLAATIIGTGASGAWSAAQTYGAGYYAKVILQQAMITERARQNSNFRMFMLSQDGEAFLKLLILAMNVGKSEKELKPLTDMNDPKIRFVLNLARSARMCSAADRKLFDQMNKDEKVAGSLSATKRQILKYACDTKLSQGRISRFYAELQTFNEIPQGALPDLRIADYQFRLRMGQLLMQMQFLDGDRDWKEIDFFNTVASKYLGFDESEDKTYFKRLHSFIVNNDGLREEETSPTGYTIATRPGLDNPYDMTIGYMNTNGPDSPDRMKSVEEPKLSGSRPSMSGFPVGTGFPPQ